MSDPLDMRNFDMYQALRRTDERLRETETKETPALYLPWSQETLLPITAAAGATHRMPLPFPVRILAVYVSVFVLGTNNGANFWTSVLTASGGPGATVCTFDTSAVTVNTWARLTVTISNQPTAAEIELELNANPTGAPGPYYLVPAVALVRTV